MKIRELYEFSKANNLKSRWQMNIHDELSWEKHKDEDEIFFIFKKIMEDWPDTLVPIVSDMSVTTTTWAEKKGVENLNELQVYFSN
jgi:DNA polymerase I-like protein with 3'-5' exonuclease and polymerase domains